MRLGCGFQLLEFCRDLVGLANSLRLILSQHTNHPPLNLQVIGPTSGSSWTLRSSTCSFTGFGNCKISIERLWLYPRRMNPFFSSVVMCLCTVASDVSFNPLPISSKLGA